MPPVSFQGIVTRTGKMFKTCSVMVTKHFEHPKYLKMQTYRKRYLVHDEKEVARLGDKVVITHVGAFSKRKHFSITEIDRRGLGLTPETDTAREGKTAQGTARERLGVNVTLLRAKASSAKRTRPHSKPTNKAAEVKEAETQRMLTGVWNRSTPEKDAQGSGSEASDAEALHRALQREGVQ
ncbi:hypothetical protein BCR39DRAFT_555004 [Naematelia encephala]|uniref:30S ribosomal protein S17 n=1 Tax=Naematelia encephala TaxID=71784 RepID=A0A1Y2ADP7_9TREE|nr:hypothetical protein BCR39DRAFT_555004 [Naematelia encephala]